MASSAGRSSGSTAAIERPNRMACPSAGTCSERPSQRGQPVGDGAAGSATATPASRPGRPTRRPSGESGPTSSTTPTSMPPEPVTGFCILPRAATISSTSARTAAPSPPCLVASWRKDAASRLSRSTRIRTSSAPMAGSVVEALGGLRQRAGRLQDAVQPDG